jgi:hypothetical protein
MHEVRVGTEAKAAIRCRLEVASVPRELLPIDTQ